MFAGSTAVVGVAVDVLHCSTVAAVAVGCGTCMLIVVAAALHCCSIHFAAWISCSGTDVAAAAAARKQTAGEVQMFDCHRRRCCSVLAHAAWTIEKPVRTLHPSQAVFSFSLVQLDVPSRCCHATTTTTIIRCLSLAAAAAACYCCCCP